MAAFVRLLFLFIIASLLIVFSCTPKMLMQFKTESPAEHGVFNDKIPGIYQLIPETKDTVILLQLHTNGDVIWWHRYSDTIMEYQIGAWKMEDSILVLLHGPSMFPRLPPDSVGISIFGVAGSMQHWHIVGIAPSGFTAKVPGKKTFHLKKEYRPNNPQEQKYCDKLSDNNFRKQLISRWENELQRYNKNVRSQQIIDMLHQQRFMLGADYVITRGGRRYKTLRELNYIMIDSLNGCLQSGLSFGKGLNKLGGITLEGVITNYKIQENPRKSGIWYLVTISMTTNLWGTLILKISVNENGTASAFVTGGTLPGHFIYRGELADIDGYGFFKGRGL